MPVRPTRSAVVHAGQHAPARKLVREGFPYRPAQPRKLISGHRKEGERDMWRIRDTQGRELLLPRECLMGGEEAGR